MEISNELEIRMIVTSRKIRHFNEAIAQLKQYGALTNIGQMEQTRDELVADFDRLKQQILAFELVD